MDKTGHAGKVARFVLPGPVAMSISGGGAPAVPWAM